MIYTIDDCNVINLPKITDPRGNLSFVEGNKHVPFQINRVYYIYDVPGGAERGGHAHRELTQLIIAVAGSFDVVLDDGTNKKTVNLSRCYKGLIVTQMIWREIVNFSSGAVCLVLASEQYSEDDYYRVYADFIKDKNLT